MLTRILTSFLVLLGLVCGAAQAFAQQSPASKDARPSLAEVLDATHQRRTLGAWWGGIAVIQGGKPVLVKGYGYANESLAPFDAEALFDLGHLSCQFTATAILRLEQEGKLSINDPISKYFPSAPEGAGKITLKQLLQHRSGLSDKEPLPTVDVNVRDEVVGAVLNTKLAREPGVQFEYAQRGYTLLAAVVEVVSKQPFDEYIRTQVFQAAGMKHTGFMDGVGLDRAKQCTRMGAMARGDFTRGPVLPEDSKTAWNWGLRGGAGVVSTLNDMVAWEAAFRKRTILNDTQTAKMLALEDNNYAMAWYVNTTPRSTRYAWHGGSSQGLKALFFNYLDEDTSIFVVTNDSGLPDQTIYALQDVLFPPMPEAVRLVMHPTDFPRTLDPVVGSNTAVELSEAIAWEIHPIEGGSELALSRSSDHKLIARLALTEGSVRRLHAQLSDVLLGKPKDDGSPVISRLTLSKYAVPESGIFGIGNPVRIEARVLYRGLAADKSEIVDRRPCIVVVDPVAGQDALVVRMDPNTANQLRSTLRTAFR